MPAAIALVLLMTWICVLGTDVSARLQNILILVQVVSLLVFAAVAIFRALDGDSPLDEIDPSARLAQPVRRRRRGAELRPAARRLRLLGLGVGGQPERGDPGRRQDARPRGAAVDVHPAGDLRVRGDRGRRLRRHPVAQRQRRRGGVRLLLPRDRGPRRLGLGPAALGLDRGDRLDADHDPPGLPDRPVDGPARRHPGAGRPHPPAAPHPRRQHLDASPRSRSSGTSGCTRSARTRCSTR